MCDAITRSHPRVVFNCYFCKNVQVAQFDSATETWGDMVEAMRGLGWHLVLRRNHVADGETIVHVACPSCRKPPEEAMREQREAALRGDCAFCDGKSRIVPASGSQSLPDTGERTGAFVECDTCVAFMYFPDEESPARHGFLARSKE